MAVACSSFIPDAFKDFRCLGSYPLDQVGSGNFF